MARLPRLERLLLDGDVSALVRPYLEAVGFDVLFATQVEVDIQDDTDILRWARRRRRIMVCHDKHRDRQTKYRLFREVYEHGGRIIRIGGGSDQPALTSAGKVIVYRDKWVEFFQENDGMVLVHETGMRKFGRSYFLRQYRKVLIDPTEALKATSRRRRQSSPRRPRQIPPEQQHLPLKG